MGNNEIINHDLNALAQKKQLTIDQITRKKHQYNIQLNENLKKLVTHFNDKFVDVENITDEVIDELLTNNITDLEADKKELVDIVNKILDSQVGIEKINYYIKRDTIDESTQTLDLSLSIHELNMVKKEAREVLFKKYKLDLILQSSETFNSIFRSFSEKNVDLRVRYEIEKSIMCNRHGYTPESVDKYFDAIKNYNESKLSTVGENIPKVGYVQSSKVNREFEHILEKVPNWNGEDPVYVSEFLENYKNKIDEIEKNLPKDTEGAVLYNEYKKYVSEKSSVEKNVSLNGASLSHKIDANKKVEKSLTSLREQRLARRKKREEEKKHVEVTEVVKTEETPVTPIIEEVKPTITNKPENVIDYDSLINKEPEIKEEKEEVIVIEEQPIQVEEEIVIPKQEIPTEVVIEEVTKVEEVITEIVKPVVEEAKVETKTVFNIDEVFKVVEQKPDLNILRSNRPDKLKLFNESQKYGRLLYLPYSNYEILVKRIQDRGQLSYILDIMNQYKLATDGTVEFEIVRVVYRHLEFFFDETPSEMDFYKNLSPRDLPIIINTLAMISQKEDDNGRVLVKVDRLNCVDQNHNMRVELTSPITLDIKSRFNDMYPIDIYYNNYGIYKEKNYATIYNAYADSKDGELTSLAYDDGILKYDVIYGRPSYYLLSEETKKKKNECIFKVYAQDINDMSDEDLYESFGDLDIKSYIKDKTLINIQLRYSEMIELYPDITDEILINDPDRSDDEKMVLEEYRILDRILKGLDATSENINNMLDVLICIRKLKVTIKETNEVVINLDSVDLYSLFVSVIDVPQALYSSMLEKYRQYVVEIYSYEYKSTYLKVKSSEIQGLINVSNHLKDFAEFEKEIRQKYKSEEAVKTWIDSYNDSKEKLTHGKCVCGVDEFYVNHFNLLFFCISHQLGVKIGQTY